MRGVTTQVSAPKSSTGWTTALNKNQDTPGAAPSLLRIRISLCHTACALGRFLTTTDQLFSAAETTCPKYLKDVTISRGHTYALKALDVTNLSSSYARRRLFRSAPFLHCAMCRCILFNTHYGTIMSHRGSHWWVRLTFSRITTVYRMGR